MSWLQHSKRNRWVVIFLKHRQCLHHAAAHKVLGLCWARSLPSAAVMNCATCRAGCMHCLLRNSQAMAGAAGEPIDEACRRHHQCLDFLVYSHPLSYGLRPTLSPPAVICFRSAPLIVPWSLISISYFLPVLQQEDTDHWQSLHVEHVHANVCATGCGMPVVGHVIPAAFCTCCQ